MKYILRKPLENNYYTKNGSLTDYLPDARDFDTLKEIKEFVKKYAIKKSDYFIVSIEKEKSNLFYILCNQLSSKGTRHDANFLVYTIFKKNLPTNYTLSDIYASIHQMIDVSLRRKIHGLQITTTADKANLLLLFKKCNDISISFGVYEDGICKYCVINDPNLIPTYYKRITTISGEFKIMDNDCSKTYTQSGTELNGTYNVLQAGRSFIFYERNNWTIFK